ncbi:MAG: tryptophan--tRNA ligase [Bdellovibrionales bacterium]|nr:tryptophan--tRNA ligase [Bdellovibrionales bacterium]
MTPPVKDKRALSGIRPSGDVHIGNYLGMLQPALGLQAEYQCIYVIVDLHALTTQKDPKALYEQSLDLAATWVALGLDIKDHILFRQSDVPQVTEFTWYLSSIVGMGLLEKAHAYKDAAAQSKDLNHAVFAYPVLMAADILMYDIDIVPVGKDQKQHVEMARDMAGSFNAIYGEGVIKLPQPVIKEEVQVIPGLDGRKMSKSYNNTIPLFAPEKQLRKKVLSITTDSTPLEEPKSLKGTLLGEYMQFFATHDQINDLEARLQAGGLGWGHAKDELFQHINDHIKDARERYQELRGDEQQLLEILTDGAERATEIADPILQRVRDAVGTGKRNRRA